MEAEIAPSYKFKLAVNRGLPYLIPHGLSGELLPRRCTITGLLPLAPVSVSILLTIAYAVVRYLDILRRHSKVLAPLRLLNATAMVLHTVFFFSVALSSPSRTLGFPKQICYLDCPDFPHVSRFSSLNARLSVDFFKILT